MEQFAEGIACAQPLGNDKAGGYVRLFEVFDRGAIEQDDPAGQGRRALHTAGNNHEAAYAQPPFQLAQRRAGEKPVAWRSGEP